MEEATIQDFAQVSEEVQQMEKERQQKNGNQVFKGMKVFIQREVPFHAVYFVLKCGGAEVCSDFSGAMGSPPSHYYGLYGTNRLCLMNTCFHQIMIRSVFPPDLS